MLTRIRGLFQKATPVAEVIAPSAPAPHDYAVLAKCAEKPVLTGEELISLLQLHTRIAELRELMSLPAQDWQQCCLGAIWQFAEAVQLAPASEVHHHAYCGGLLVHTLDAAIIALKLRRKYSLPAGAGAERVNEAATRWTYGVLIAMLLHDPGKVGASVALMARSESGAMVRWSPLNGSMQAHGMRSYQISFEPAPYSLHNQVGLALFSQIVPEAGRRWLSADRELLQQLLSAVVDVHAPGSGVIGELLIQADGQSVAKDLGQPRAQGQTTGAVAMPLVDKYMRALRRLLADKKFVLNKPGAQIFVVRRKNAPESASVAWLLCRAVAEAIVKELRAADPTVPTDPARVYDTLQEHGLCVPTASGRAIWNARVHSNDWSAEFSMLKMEAFRLWGPGRVPEGFAGSVKMIKAGSVVEKTAEPAAQPPHQTAPGSSKRIATPPESDEDSALLSALFQPVKRPKNQPATPRKPTPDAAVKADVVENAELRTTEPEERQVSVPVEIMPTAEPEEATSEPTTESVATPQGATRPTIDLALDHADAFFAWVKSQLTMPDADINSASASLHVHEDGLLLVTPKIFKTFAGDGDRDNWVDVQKAVMKSGFMLTIKRRQVHQYLVRDPQGKVSKTPLNCAVILPAACKVLFAKVKLPARNASILGQK